MGLFGSRKPQIKISVFGKTDRGRTRDHNEDSFLVADLTTREASLQPTVREHAIGPKGSLLLVADGMGGAASGEVASQMAIDSVYQHLLRIAQQLGQKILSRAPYVDFIFGPQNIHRISEALKGDRLVIANEDNPMIADDDLPALRKEKGRAWVTIMYGCNNFCSYCIVP